MGEEDECGRGPRRGEEEGGVWEYRFGECRGICTGGVGEVGEGERVRERLVGLVMVILGFPKQFVCQSS